MRRKNVIISVKDRELLASYYKKAFENLQQSNCRVLTITYIKLVEPCKKASYPYKSRKIVTGFPKQFNPEMTKPP